MISFFLINFLFGNNFSYNTFSLIIVGQSLKTLNLNKLRSIENGKVLISAENLCLDDTINWEAITGRNNSMEKIKKNSPNCGIEILS